jgi:hypothetical protein
MSFRLAPGDSFLAPNTILGPRQDSETAGGDRLFATLADAEVSGIEPVEGFFDQFEGVPLEPVEAQADGFGMRNLGLVFFAYTVGEGKSIQLHAELCSHFPAFLH